MDGEANNIVPYLEVIVADGDATFCILVEEYLRLLRCRNVYLVTTEELALWKLKRRHFDILMLETCREYKHVWENVMKGEYNRSLIIGMTFDRTGRDWLKAMNYGADAILTKPFTRERLAHALSGLLISPASRRCKIVQMPVAAARLGERDSYKPVL